jgi:hypothetical protein
MRFSPASDTSYHLDPYVLVRPLFYRPPYAFTLMRETMFHTHVTNTNYQLRSLLFFRFKFFIFSYFSPMPPHVPYGLRGLSSRLWPKCNRLLRLGRP